MRTRHEKRCAALVVAAGRGVRAGGDIPKQFRDLRGKPVLRHTLDALLASAQIDQVICVIHGDDATSYRAAVTDLNDNRLGEAVIGGATRHASVRAGLRALSQDAPDRVLIHDAARPFISSDLISRLIAALDDAPAACPGLPVVDTLWAADGQMVAHSVSRDRLWRAQTPQAFRFTEIERAHADAMDAATDDVAVAHEADIPVKLVMGDGNNFKITLPGDFDRAERLLEG